MDCLFCKIIKKELPSKILYEDDLVIVIMDLYPEVDGHTLVIPKKHYEDLQVLPDEVLLHINSVAKDMTNKLLTKLDLKSLTWIINYGQRQAIKHYHLHLLPNYGKNLASISIDEIYEKLQ